MATITKTESGTWKALIRKRSWPTTIKTFRLKRDAQDWARRIEDQMVRGVYVHRTMSERTPVAAALHRYLREVSALKSPGAHRSEAASARALKEALGRYSLATLTPDLIAEHRDERLASVSERTGQRLSQNTVRLELALLSHLYCMNSAAEATVNSTPDSAKEVTELKRLVVQQQREIRLPQKKLHYALHRQFGRSSEQSNPDQIALFSPSDDLSPPDEDEEETQIVVRRKKGARRQPPKDLPRERIEQDLPEADKHCACGASLERVGEETREQYDVIPPVFRVLEPVRFK